MVKKPRSKSKHHLWWFPQSVTNEMMMSTGGASSGARNKVEYVDQTDNIWVLRPFGSSDSGGGTTPPLPETGACVLYVDSETNGSDGTTFTFNDVSLGDEFINRMIIIGIALPDNGGTVQTVSGATLDGSAMALIHSETGAAGQGSTALYGLRHAEGLTGDFSVTTSGTVSSCTITVYPINPVLRIPVDADGKHGTGAIQLTDLEIVVSGQVVIVSLTQNAGVSMTWSGIDVASHDLVDLQNDDGDRVNSWSINTTEALTAFDGNFTAAGFTVTSGASWICGYPYPYQFLNQNVRGPVYRRPGYLGTDQPSFIDLDIGDTASPSATRLIVALCAYEETGLGVGPFDFNGCIINGVTATEVVTSIASGTEGDALFVAAVPTGYIADASFGISGTLPVFTDSAMMVYGMDGYSATPFDTASTLVAATSASVTIDVPSGGIIVAGCYRQDAAYVGTTWTGVDEVYDVADGDADFGLTLAARVYAVGANNVTITAAKTEGGANRVHHLVVASFSPV